MTTGTPWAISRKQASDPVGSVDHQPPSTATPYRPAQAANVLPGGDTVYSRQTRALLENYVRVVDMTGSGINPNSVKRSVRN